MAIAAHRLLPDEPIATLEEYEAQGGGSGLREALALEPDDVIERVRASGLRGRGGAGFPTGIKWASVRAAGQADPGSTTYAVANGAEGEPGTYKDRALMLQNPHQVLEGLLIAMHAVGAERAYLAVKRRFEAVLDRVVDALAEIAAAGWEGADRVDLITGPDEYLFGEEKALLEVIEGKLPMPRIMPPYQVGLFATMQHPNPTLMNNVETLANVPTILAHGPQRFREVGSEESPGTMIFTVTGDVAAPGVYELPLGTSLRTLIEDIAGAEDVKAIFSGVATAVITPDLLDVPTGFDSMADAGTGLGSAGFVVYDSSHCIVRIAATLSHFLAIESCGQCLACKLGTESLTGLLERIDRGEGEEDDLDALIAGAAKVTDLNRCALPIGEQLIVGSVVQQYADEFTAHLGRPCPSGREVAVPKIEQLDLETGEVTFDPEYARKRGDWSYAPG